MKEVQLEVKSTFNDHFYQAMLIGGYPPPKGGVTIHIKRFYEYCQSRGFPVRIVTPFNSAPDRDGIILKGITSAGKLLHLIAVMKNFSGKIVHIHSAQFNKFIFGGFIILYSARNKIKLVTIHSDISTFLKKRNLKYMVIKNILRHFDYIICINEDQKNFFSKSMHFSPDKLITIPSYIPVQRFPQKVSKEIKDFVISARSQVDYLVISSGYLTEIYGFDLILRAIKELNEFRIGIIFLFYTYEDSEYSLEIKQKIESFEHVWTFRDISSDDFFYLISNSDLFIRANRKDTYGMVIGDSLALRTPVIASDVCPRHPGTILFESNNVMNLAQKMKDTLLHLKEIKKQISAIKIESYAEDLFNFYQKILK